MMRISFGGSSEVVDAMLCLGRMDQDWEAGSSPPSAPSASTASTNTQ
jgi:hypothetical protein